jgi:hypothetical protein
MQQCGNAGRRQISQFGQGVAQQNESFISALAEMDGKGGQTGLH